MKSDDEKFATSNCYNGYSRYAENINYSDYVIANKSYFKGLLMHEDKIYRPRFEH